MKSNSGRPPDATSDFRVQSLFHRDIGYSKTSQAMMHGEIQEENGRPRWIQVRGGSRVVCVGTSIIPTNSMLEKLRQRPPPSCQRSCIFSCSERVICTLHLATLLDYSPLTHRSSSTVFAWLDSGISLRQRRGRAKTVISTVHHILRIDSYPLLPWISST